MSKKILFAIPLILFLSLPVQCQVFEGWITYKTEAKNPHPEKMPDSVWMAGVKEQLGNKEYLMQKYTYSNGNYLSEIDEGNIKGYQLYNQTDKFIYSWKAGSDTALTSNSKKFNDKVLDVVYTNQEEVVLGIPCKSIFIKTKEGGITLWYNKDYFKMDYKLFKGHDYGLWNKILKEIGCIPLKIERKGMMVHILQTAVNYKETSISDEVFQIPTFDVIIENPSN